MMTKSDDVDDHEVTRDDNEIMTLWKNTLRRNILRKNTLHNTIDHLVGQLTGKQVLFDQSGSTDVQ